MVVTSRTTNEYLLNLTDKEVLTVKEQAAKQEKPMAEILHAAVVVGFDTAFGDKEE